MPDIDGLDLTNQIRDTSHVATIVLTIRSHPSDRILGVELGADDYVVKPSRRPPEFAGWIFDPGTCTLASPQGERIALSVTKARLLKAMTRRPNRVLSREYLLDQRGGTGAFAARPQHRPRGLGAAAENRKDPRNPEIITTVYGAGYVFSVPAGWRRSSRGFAKLK